MKLLTVILLAIVLIGCASPAAPGTLKDGGRFIVVGTGPGSSEITLEQATGRCYVVSVSYYGFEISSPAPAEWCEK